MGGTLVLQSHVAVKPALRRHLPTFAARLLRYAEALRPLVNHPRVVESANPEASGSPMEPQPNTHDRYGDHHPPDHEAKSRHPHGPDRLFDRSESLPDPLYLIRRRMALPGL